MFRIGLEERASFFIVSSAEQKLLNASYDLSTFSLGTGLHGSSFLRVWKTKKKYVFLDAFSVPFNLTEL